MQSPDLIKGEQHHGRVWVAFILGDMATPELCMQLHVVGYDSSIGILALNFGMCERDVSNCSWRVKPDRHKILDRCTGDYSFRQTDRFTELHRDSSELSDGWIEPIKRKLIGKPEFKCVLIHLNLNRLQRLKA